MNPTGSAILEDANINNAYYHADADESLLIIFNVTREGLNPTIRTILEYLSITNNW